MTTRNVLANPEDYGLKIVSALRYLSTTHEKESAFVVWKTFDTGEYLWSYDTRCRCGSCHHNEVFEFTKTTKHLCRAPKDDLFADLSNWIRLNVLVVYNNDHRQLMKDLKTHWCVPSDHDGIFQRLGARVAHTQKPLARNGSRLDTLPGYNEMVATIFTLRSRS